MSTPVTLLDRSYAPDRMDRRLTLGGVVFAALGAAVFTLAGWFALKQTSLPAFGPSMVTRALATAVSGLLMVAVIVLLVWWLQDEKLQRERPQWRRWLTVLVSYFSPAALVVALIGIPLSATRLYLEGVTVDQGFRTQYLTRLADSWQLSDMNYADLPAYYPAGWFWLGGRLANLLGVPGWEAFQPWSLITLAVAGSVLVPVWQRLVGSLPVATAIALVSTAAVLVTSGEEPYAAIIALGIPAAAVMSSHALRGGNFAAAAVAFYLGVSATFYTLYTAIAALSVVVIAFAVALLTRDFIRPILRLAIIGLSSMAIAAIVWAPYLLTRLSGAHASNATAQHYLPLVGTQIPMPMFSASFVGLLCMAGLLYVLVRIRVPEVLALGLALAVSYLWVIGSMLATLFGTTLLGFRLNGVITQLLLTLGVLAVAELRKYGYHRLIPQGLSTKASKAVTVCMAAVLGFGLMHLLQQVPNKLEHSIDLAYTDTDGYGERADRYPPDAAQYYAQVAAEIGGDPGNTVVMTDEKNFLSFNPYRGFQAFTSHYANPLGEFELRNQAIEQWAQRSWEDLDTPAAFLAAMEATQAEHGWRMPDAFVFRADLEAAQLEAAQEEATDGWNYDIAEDIYPNNPNVRFHGVRFNPEVFLGQGSVWNATQIGPFVVVTRG
ncbi:galactan 5-O-arabinofuranosyltransferase [Corynebacterium kozikiae]|uniref:galactan 5-O-arabinofuranosyltransferase n=1 Tax=Corynebacterium kozikiae TaxID=2968469 RepID=UPI00211B8726|nr:galactan 5-O-arabinofuranosyltransferase [Corynebacterium sp. 76QC2CO]MCQ9343528.1 galactan 5-O-arabinofuranosyltransferase [Corynebacterium sp. 76QC2CO]